MNKKTIDMDFEGNKGFVFTISKRTINSPYLQEDQGRNQQQN